MTNNDLFNLKNKTALIVGASSGIGEHFAKTLATAGAELILAARREDRLTALQQELLAAGNKAHVHPVDVTNPNSVKTLFSKLEQEKHAIDIMVNTAGMNIRSKLLDYTVEEWDKVIRVNLDGTWFVAQETARHMLQHKKGGSIIHISSVLDNRTLRASSPAYHAAKAGVEHLTRMLALDLAEQHIRVNNIAPGFFETDLNRALLRSEKSAALKNSIPMQRTGELKELEGALLLLASDASSYITGSTLRVDGGYATNHILEADIA